MAYPCDGTTSSGQGCGDAASHPANLNQERSRFEGGLASAVRASFVSEILILPVLDDPAASVVAAYGKPHLPQTEEFEKDCRSGY